MGFLSGLAVQQMSEDTRERVLQVKDLRTYFYTKEGVVKAVDGLSYHVKKGECVGLVGESACGKSVSAMSVLRLIPYPPGIIVGGEIMFKGEDLLQATEERMRDIRGNRIAMVFQEPTTSLNPVLTVGRQISESLELHRGLDKEEATKEAVRLLDLVGIPDAEQRVKDHPHQFSGGMQQRIMIAMALSCDPEILIADEPTTSLDVTVQAQVLEVLDKMREEFGTAVMIITHNLGVVARYVDRVNVMYAGNLVETGPTETIYAEPKHPYTLGLLASVPRLDAAEKVVPKVIKGLPPNMAKLPPGCAFAPRCDYAMDRCRAEKPPLEKVGEEHYRACFYDASKLHRTEIKIREEHNE
jgi:oligopeptide transport system ATP-binding protein